MLDGTAVPCGFGVGCGDRVVPGFADGLQSRKPLAAGVAVQGAVFGRSLLGAHVAVRAVPPRPRIPTEAFQPKWADGPMVSRGPTGRLVLGLFSRIEIEPLLLLHATEDLISVVYSFPSFKKALGGVEPVQQSREIVDELTDAFIANVGDSGRCARALCNVALKIYLSGQAGECCVKGVLALLDGIFASAAPPVLNAADVGSEFQRVMGELACLHLAVWEGLKQMRVAQLPRARARFWRGRISAAEFGLIERAASDGSYVVLIRPLLLSATEDARADDADGGSGEGTEVLLVVESRVSDVLLSVGASVQVSMLPPFAILEVGSIEAASSGVDEVPSPVTVTLRDVTFGNFADFEHIERETVVIAGESAPAAEASDLRARLSATEDDLASVRAENRQLLQELADLRAMIGTVQAKAAEVVAAPVDAQARVARELAERKAAELIMARASADARLADAEARLGDAEAMLQKARAELSRVRAERARLDEEVSRVRWTAGADGTLGSVMGEVICEGSSVKSPASRQQRIAVIPAVARQIAPNSFKRCYALEELWCEEGSALEVIGEGAFRSCEGLRVVKLPPSLRVIAGDVDNGAFQGCVGLSTMEFSPELTTIGGWAFRGCVGLVSLQLPSGLTSIGKCAFRRCTGLTEVRLPVRLSVIGECAFDGCTALKMLQLPPGISVVDVYAFAGCTGLTTVEFAQGVTSVRAFAFSGCTGLTAMRFPAGFSSIGKWAFSKCPRLTSLELPPGLTSIAKGAFAGCTALASVQVPGDATVAKDAFPRGCHVEWL